MFIISNYKLIFLQYVIISTITIIYDFLYFVTNLKFDRYYYGCFLSLTYPYQRLIQLLKKQYNEQSLKEEIKMFGGPLKFPKIDKTCRTKSPIGDIRVPHPFTSGQYAHYGRAENTDHHVRMLHYKQRHNEFINKYVLDEANRLLKDRYLMSYEKHVDGRQIEARINRKVQQKWKVYEDTIKERQKKLQQLYAKEEIDYYSETVDTCQKGDTERLADIKQQAEMIKAKREAERLKIVEQKRHQQFLQNCTDLRPVLIKKNLIESKKVQLEQMKENQRMRELERDLENRWHELMLKDQQAHLECEKRKLQKRNQDTFETQSIVQQQIQNKESLLKEENKRRAEEEHLEMLELKQRIQREEMELLNKKRRERDQRERELKEQIAMDEKRLQERKQAEEELEQRLAQLAQAEIDKEKANYQNTKLINRREIKLYQQYLSELQKEREREEEKFTILLEENRRAIEEKQRQAKCEMMKAKQRLLEDVMKGRDEQLQLKQKQTENELKMKQAENELLKLSLETYARLQAEHDRLCAENERLYKEEIKQQIEINNQRRQQEKEEMEREYRAGLEEERRLRQIIEDYKKSIKPVTPHKHPFKYLLDTHDCTIIETSPE